RDGEAALVDGSRLPGDLHDARVDEVADLVVDVVAEHAQADADLRGGDSGPPGRAHTVEEIGDETRDPLVDGSHRVADGLEDGITEETDPAFGHGLSLSRSSSSASAASSACSTTS